MKCYSSVIAALLLWSGSALAQTCTQVQSTPPIFSGPVFTGTCVSPVTPPPMPTATLSANPTTINSGQSSTLTWASTNATSCLAGGGWSGTQATSGSATVMPTATTGYTLSCSGAGGISPVASATVTVSTTPPVNACNMQLGGPAIFCDTFDAPAGTGNRSGQLNGTIWGNSRWTGDMNFGSAFAVPWVKATLDGCSGPLPVQPENDIIICNGQMREATNDNAQGCFECGTVTAMTIYPKQPFDFAGRTGTISFDLSNDTQGSHGAWPEIWITDTPRPTPFLHFQGSGGTIPANAIGIRFENATTPGQGNHISPNCPNDNNGRWSVGSVVVVRNYAIEDTFGFGTSTGMQANILGCLIKSGPNGPLSHVEIRVSQNQVDVYGTDPGTTTPLIHLASITNANLSFTRGLIWLEDVHYNADKSLQTPLQHNHTFTWDNVAFDGPPMARDLSYDVLDSLTQCHDGTLCLGWDSCPSCQVNMPIVSTMPIAGSAIPAASAQFLMFNAWFQNQPQSFSFTLNGHPYTYPWPFPFSSGQGGVSAMFPVNKADLVAGPNAILIWADQYIVVSNINIVLAGAGGMPPPPGNPLPPRTPMK